MKTIALANLCLSRSIAFLAIACALSVFLYAFFLLEAVAHTAQRSTAERASLQLTAKLGSLEAAYLAQSRDITPQLATAMGFVAPTVVTSVYAQAPAMLTLNTR